MKTNISKKKKGFTLLFAVLLSVLVLAVGTSIINIALKQVILSGVGRESQYAFYAANSGIECALYWDYKLPDYFATSSDSLGYDVKAVPSCAEKELFSVYDAPPNSEFISVTNETVNSAESTFTYIIDDDLQYCATVRITKNKEEGKGMTTIIESRGYNTCDTNNPRRIERGLKLSY